MVDQKVIDTYSEMHPPEVMTDGPLVTFALFAYNQEKYIREAVEGAFSQTYSPLEIILSDDCSSDKTFDIMEEMARGYRGPHRVFTRRGPRNQGLMQHIRSVVEVSSGHFVIVAAGDDVSLPERSAKLTETMLREGSDVAASNYSKISEDGQLLEENLINDYRGNYLWEIVDAPSEHFANGASASYRRSFLLKALDAISQTNGSQRIYNEDIVFSAFSVALGSVPSSFEKAPLIMYRINTKSLSNFSAESATFQGQLEIVQREVFRSASRQACLLAILEIASHYPRLNERLNVERINRDLRLSLIELAASEVNIFQRAKALTVARSLSEFNVVFLRLFGLKFLASLRYLAAMLKLRNHDSA